MAGPSDTRGDRTWYGATTVLTLLFVLAAARSARAGRLVTRAAILTALVGQSSTS
jgi:hypothetical protein